MQYVKIPFEQGPYIDLKGFRYRIVTAPDDVVLASLYEIHEFETIEEFLSDQNLFTIDETGRVAVDLIKSATGSVSAIMRILYGLDIDNIVETIEERDDLVVDGLVSVGSHVLVNEEQTVFTWNGSAWEESVELTETTLSGLIEVDQSLQNSIAALDGRVEDLEGAAESLTEIVAENVGSISEIESAVSALEAYRLDHSNRISVLESYGSSGGGYEGGNVFTSPILMDSPLYIGMYFGTVVDNDEGGIGDWSFLRKGLTNGILEFGATEQFSWLDANNMGSIMTLNANTGLLSVASIAANAISINGHGPVVTEDRTLQFTGTANQIAVSNSNATNLTFNRSWQFSTPQNLDVGANFRVGTLQVGLSNTTALVSLRSRTQDYDMMRFYEKDTLNHYLEWGVGADHTKVFSTRELRSAAPSFLFTSTTTGTHYAVQGTHSGAGVAEFYKINLTTDGGASGYNVFEVDVTEGSPLSEGVGMLFRAKRGGEVKFSVDSAGSLISLKDASLAGRITLGSVSPRDTHGAIEMYGSQSSFFIEGDDLFALKYNVSSSDKYLVGGVDVHRIIHDPHSIFWKMEYASGEGRSAGDDISWSTSLQLSASVFQYAGSVKIGAISTPTAALDVAGGIVSSAASNFMNFKVGTEAGLAQTAHASYYGESAYNLRFSSDGNLLLNAATSIDWNINGVFQGRLLDGAWGIGTNAPEKRLHVLSSTGDMLRLARTGTSYSDHTLSDGGLLTVSISHDGAPGSVAFDVQQILPKKGYFTNIGAETNKFLAGHIAELWSETLVSKETISTMGGRILIGRSTTLTRPLLASDVDENGEATVYFKHNDMAVNDTLIVQSRQYIEYLRVVSGPVTITNPGWDEDHEEFTSGEFSYVVERDLTETGLKDWIEGDSAFNTGSIGDGFIDLHSHSPISDPNAVTSTGSSIHFNVRKTDATSGGSYFSDWSPRAVVGSLHGVYGYGVTQYGFAAGDYDKAWVSVDESSGFRISSGSEVKAHWDIDGSITIGGANPVTSLNYMNGLPFTFMNGSSFDLMGPSVAYAHIRMDETEAYWSNGIVKQITILHNGEIYLNPNLSGYNYVRASSQTISFYNALSGGGHRESIRLSNDGSGFLANSHIHWDAAGILYVDQSAVIAGWTISENKFQSGAEGATRLTLESTESFGRMYVGGGVYADEDTPFYVDEQGRLSLGDKLTFSEGVLSIAGAVGITWTDVADIPTRFGDTDAPESEGVYLSASYLGYHNGDSWTNYLSGDGSGALASGKIQWDTSGNLNIDAILSLGSLPSLPSDAFLTAFYNFNEGGGSVLLDQSPNASHASISGIAAYGNGVSGSCLVFGGATSVSIDPSVIEEDGSVSCWVFASETDELRVIGSEHASGSNYEIRTFYSGGSLYVSLPNGVGPQEVSTAFSADTWYHLTFTWTFDSVDTTLSLYLDGELKDTRVFSGAISSGASSLTIGHWDGGFFEGAIDEFRVYAKALSISEIRALYVHPQGHVGTLISGSRITTGVIRSSNFGETTGSRFDLTSGTLEVGGTGSSAKLYFNGSVLAINGSVTATVGAIGGFTIGATTLTGGDLELSSTGAIGHTGGLWNLASDGSGSLASGVIAWTDEGVMSISGGTVGGWSVSSTGLETGVVRLDPAGFMTIAQETKSYGEVGGWIGVDAGLFKVSFVSSTTTDKLLWTGSNLEITGSILATSGAITDAVLIGGTRADLVSMQRFGFENGFDVGEFELWTATEGHTITQDYDNYSGGFAALIGSSVGSPVSADIPSGVRITIPNRLAMGFSGRRAQISFYAKKPASNASNQFAVIYSTNDNGGSGWINFSPTTSWKSYYVEIDVPVSILGGDDYFAIHGDVSGLGGQVLIDRVFIQTAPRYSDDQVTAAGLYLTKSYMGYWDGTSSWTSRIKSDGTFSFGSGALTWNNTKLSVTGIVSADEGNIGGWTIDTGELYSGDIHLVTGAGIYVSDSGTAGYNRSDTPVWIGSDGKFSLRNKLTVDADGNLVVGGTVTAGAGSSIGGWTVQSDRLVGGILELMNTGALRTNDHVGPGSGYRSAKIFVGVDSDEAKFSLGDKFYYDGDDLYIDGATTIIGGGTIAGSYLSLVGGEMDGWITFDNDTVSSSSYGVRFTNFTDTYGIYSEEYFGSEKTRLVINAIGEGADDYILFNHTELGNTVDLLEIYRSVVNLKVNSTVTGFLDVSKSLRVKSSSLTASWTFDTNEGGVMVGSGYTTGYLYAEGSVSARMVLVDSGASANQKAVVFGVQDGYAAISVFTDAGSISKHFAQFDTATGVATFAYGVSFGGALAQSSTAANQLHSAMFSRSSTGGSLPDIYASSGPLVLGAGASDVALTIGASLLSTFSGKVKIGAAASSGALLDVYSSVLGVSETQVLAHSAYSAGKYVGSGYRLGANATKAFFGFEAGPASGNGLGEFVWYLDAANDANSVATTDEVMRLKASRLTIEGGISVKGTALFGYSNTGAQYGALQINASDNTAIPTTSLISHGATSFLWNVADDATNSSLLLRTRTTGASVWMFLNEWKETYKGDLVLKTRTGASTSIEAFRLSNGGVLTIPGYVVMTPPAAPTSLGMVESGSSITVSWTASIDPGVDYYEVYASIGGTSRYEHIGTVQDDLVGSISFLHDSYARFTTIYYKVFAVRNGLYSTSLAGSKVQAAAVADVTSVVLTADTEAYYLSYVLPVDKRLSHVQIKKAKHADSELLDEEDAVTVYEGLENQFIYRIPTEDLDLYHQFWVYSIPRT